MLTTRFWYVFTLLYKRIKIILEENSIQPGKSLKPSQKFRKSWILCMSKYWRNPNPEDFPLKRILPWVPPLICTFFSSYGYIHLPKEPLASDLSLQMSLPFITTFGKLFSLSMPTFICEMSVELVPILLDGCED